MRVVSPKLRDDLAAGRPVRLNLGVGRRPRDGYYGLDWIEMPGVYRATALSCQCTMYRLPA